MFEVEGICVSCEADNKVGVYQLHVASNLHAPGRGTTEMKVNAETINVFRISSGVFYL